jgi:hypothetical protein
VSLKYLAGHRLVKVTKNHYPNDDSGIVAVMTGPAQAKLAYLVVTMTGSGLKSAQRKR